MKVAILYELLGRSRGGIEAWVYHASEELLLQGHEVTVFNAQSETPDDAVPPGVRIVTLRNPRKVPAIYHLARALSFRKQLITALDSYDAVWARSFAMAWALGKIVEKKKSVYINAAPFSFYGTIPFDERMRNAHGLNARLRVVSGELSLLCARILEKKAIQSCLNVYLSQARRDETLRYFGLKNDSFCYYVIPAGVNIKRFFPSESGWHGIGVLRLISVCRLMMDKNIQCVIRAVSELVRNNIPVSLTVVGEGGYKGKLQELVKELKMEKYICFVGRQESVQEWYRKSHVFILPSLYEGFGSVYIEAMATGLPCIAVSGSTGKYSVGADEIIDHEVTGYLMRENDPVELAGYVSRLFKHPNEWEAYSKAARLKAASTYQWEAVVSKLLRLTSNN